MTAPIEKPDFMSESDFSVMQDVTEKLVSDLLRLIMQRIDLISDDPNLRAVALTGYVAPSVAVALAALSTGAAFTVAGAAGENSKEQSLRLQKGIRNHLFHAIDLGMADGVKAAREARREARVQKGPVR